MEGQMKQHHGRPWWMPALSGRRCVCFVSTIALCVLFSPQARSQDTDLARPKQHLSIERPRVVSGAEALSIYQNVRERMHASYLRAEIPAIAGLCEWPLYNRVPYLSATHGQRYVNNYANALAHTYGRHEQAGPMPVGAVLAKDSFTITRRGEVFAGALFVMEKMPSGFNPESHDWRYTMVMPDGSLFGTTKGEGSERVAFCTGCHEAVPERHHQMFFVPPDYRVENLLSP
jgi:hypothetical protein